MRNAFITNGAIGHSINPRIENDYYATDPKAVNLLLSLEDFNNNIWECAVGGAYSQGIRAQRLYR